MSCWMAAALALALGWVTWAVPLLLPLPQDYELGDILGQGAFGVVRVATHRVTGQRFACKTLSKSKASVGGAVALPTLPLLGLT